MKIRDFRKIADILAKQHKITLREGQRWAANLQNRVIEYVEEDLFDLPDNQVIGLLLHEIAHIHYTEPGWLVGIEKEPNKMLYKNTMNALEDISIEYLIGLDYTNAEEILTETMQDNISRVIKILPTMRTLTKFEKAIFYAIIIFNGRGFSNLKKDYEKAGKEAGEYMLQEKKRIYEREKTSDHKTLAKEIIDILTKNLGQPTDEERKRMEANDVDQTNKGERAASSVKGKVIKDIKEGHGWGVDGKFNTRIDYIEEIGDQANIIGRQLRQILKVNNAMEFGGRYAAGKLKAKRIAKIITSRDRKPFSRRIVKSNKSYAFAIACDVSVSMDGGPIHTAMSGLYMCAEALRIANVPRSLIIFGCEATEINPINKIGIRWDEIIDERKIKESKNGGTSIHNGVKMAREQLEKVQAERKIMIVLTDGESDRYKLEEEYHLTKKKGIEAIGITVKSNNYYHRYDDDGSDNSLLAQIFGEENNILVKTDESKKIGDAFIEILKNKIKKAEKQ